MNSIQVGVAVRNVHVPPGTPMAGFAAREGKSEGTHDPLTVRALALDAAALVTVDVCALHERSCEQVRAELGESVILTATHTHSGPCVSFERLGQHAATVHDDVLTAVLDAVREARAQAVPCQIRYGEAAGLGIAKNRRHRDREIDPPMQVLAFEEDIGSPEEGQHRRSRYVAHLVTYPCHPVVLDGTNRQISGDYPAVVRDAVEEGFPGSVCVFATGCAGDINTGHSATASFAPTGGGTRTFAEAQRIGRALGAAVVGVSLWDVTGPVSVEHIEVPLALERIAPAEVASQAEGWRRGLGEDAGPGTKALLRTWIAWAENWTEQYPAEWVGRVSVLKAGASAVVALPGEPFWRTAVLIRKALGPSTLVLGYADGVPGYLPPADEYGSGGYEVCDAHRYYAMPAPFARGGAERLVEAVEAMEAVTAARAETRHDH